MSGLRDGMSHSFGINTDGLGKMSDVCGIMLVGGKFQQNVTQAACLFRFRKNRLAASITFL